MTLGAAPTDEPIAIVGMACRFPGGASTPEGLWDVLSAGRDVITAFPRNRWQNAEPRLSVAGTSGGLGGFLEDITTFDPSHFHLALDEIAEMDPQTRLLCEVAGEALKDAGHLLTDARSKRGGTFIGISNCDWALLRQREYGGYLNIASAAGVVAHCLDLHGPAMAVDTACASSLSAIALACDALHKGSCDFALAGGVNLILLPERIERWAVAGLLSKSGVCRPFDDGADGFLISEGVGAIALKPLSRAQVDGDKVFATILGTATNHVGRVGFTHGVMAPRSTAQAAVIREALRAANILPDAVQYIEAMATGTRLGDALELHALATVFAGSVRPRDVGSVKGNLGHLEASTGVASVIKAALSIDRGEIPPSLHFESLNRLVTDPPPLPFAVRTVHGAWPDPTALRIAGVSGFSGSGTNVHIVLGEALPRVHIEREVTRVAPPLSSDGRTAIEKPEGGPEPRSSPNLRPPSVN